METPAPISYWLDRIIRRISFVAFHPVAWLLKPIKILAWRTRKRWLRGLLLEITGFFDWLTVIFCIQNYAMLIQQKIWKGNFLFGRAVFIVDHSRALSEIPLPTLRGNLFMGVNVVTNEPGVFMTNAGPITTSPPARTAIRQHIDQNVLTHRVRAFETGGIPAHCTSIMEQWRQQPDMFESSTIRSVVTMIYLKLLAEIELPYDEARKITDAYTRRFGEMSLLGRYLPFLMGTFSTLEALREDVFIPLKNLGVDPVAIDMTLFAAMFSNGTWALNAMRLAREQSIDYRALDEYQRIGFLMETQRFYPTVTSVHRVVEKEEIVEVAGRPLSIYPGQEVCYPFILINQDPKAFSEPTRFSYHRGHKEQSRILSWSTGPHVCPAKDLSIQVAKALLDELVKHKDFQQIRVFSPEF
ncbi:MAG: cytochrome P450 [Bacteroidota bacterium]